MMKKRLAMLLAVAMLFAAMSLAQAEILTLYRLDLSVEDGEGKPIPQAEITIIDAAGKSFSVTADDAGKAMVPMDEGTVIVRAEDPNTGWNEQVTLGVYEDTEHSFVIRTLKEGSKVTVGTFTRPNGNFSLPCLGSNASDLDIRSLLHGYATVAIGDDCVYTVNPTAVRQLNITTGNGGSKTYTFTIADNLTWNDGTPITAADYVFSVLLQASPQLKAAGASAAEYGQLEGYADYAAGTAASFAGVRLVDDATFSLTIRGDALPYYYELMYVSVTPYPAKVIAPGCTVTDDGTGAVITGLSTAMLAETLLGENGYNSCPAVTSGSYELVDYNAAEGTVSLRANRLYQGEYDGKRPVIDLVTLKTVTAGEAADLLASGEVDIVNKVTDAALMQTLTERVADDRLISANYLRGGLGHLSYACEDMGPTSSMAIRQAIAWALDREGMVGSYASGNNIPVYSYYGLGLWAAADYINDMEELVETYPQDAEKAAKLIAKAGYTFNSEGKKYKTGDGIRYRKLTQKEKKAYDEQPIHLVEAVQIGKDFYMPLQLRAAVAEGSGFGTILTEGLQEALPELGFDVQVVTMPFSQLLDEYYRAVPRTCNAYLLASNFDFVFDPYYAFSSDEAHQGSLNTTGIVSDLLQKDAYSLRRTAPGDVETYKTRWLKLEKDYADILPSMPLYSGIYFDYYNPAVKGYEPNALWSWAPAVLHSWID